MVGTPDKRIEVSESDNAVASHLTNLPTPRDLKQLTIRNVVVMSTLADSLRQSLLEYVRLDPYTVPDPFEHDDNYDYSIIVDRESSSRIVAIIAVKKVAGAIAIPWDTVLYDRLKMLTLNKHLAAELKSELMPKEENNFFSYRVDGQFLGCIMFAFQICGLKHLPL